MFYHGCSKMCEALSDLSQDDSGSFMICNCLHSWVACLFFQIFDLFAVLFTISMYGWFIYEEGHSLMATIPLTALTLSILVFPLGPIGLLMQNGSILFVYNIRILCIILFSGGWAIYVYSGDENTKLTYLTVGGIWTFAFFNYIWGFAVTFKAIRYCNDFYRGYSDVDGEEMSRFVVELEDKLSELKDREDDEKKITKRKGEKSKKISKESATSKETQSKQTTEPEQSKTK